MSESLHVSVIIPTKDRPDALAQVVKSIVTQTVVPRTLVIVDQSDDSRSRQCVEHELRAKPHRGNICTNLKFIHDPAIGGAAMARNRAMEAAEGDVWLFLDDDVVLEPDFVEQLLRVYRADPAADGVSGVITNYPRPRLASQLWNSVFMLGPFKDERQPIYWNADVLRDSPPLRAARFGCGLMSFRAIVLRGLSFDENLDNHLKGVSDGEDVDLCQRLPPGTRLLIAPRARLAHYHNPIGRLSDHWLRRHARANVFLFRKHWNNTIRNKLTYGWLWVGYTFIALAASGRRFSLDPWHALHTGMREGRAAFTSSRNTSGPALHH
jgi:GT2 family glycosyltransferase